MSEQKLMHKPVHGQMIWQMHQAEEKAPDQETKSDVILLF